MDVTHIRGMLLEEAVLYLLRRAGYRTVNTAAGDPTLYAGHSAGIAVWGRGAAHQIDAIADYIVGQPFSHPQRLLVEAKCYSNKYAIDIGTVRNAVGVLKDVSEFWNTAGGIPRNHRRYHYQKAIFSVSRFSTEAEKYAFAQDVYLFPLGASKCFQPIIDSIFGITRKTLQSVKAAGVTWKLGDMRRWIRDALNDGDYREKGDELIEWWRFVEAVQALGGILIAMVGRAFPLFLVPHSRDVLSAVTDNLRVRVRRNKDKWTLNDTNNRVLFSFELPPMLFTMYAEAGVISREASAQLKEDLFSDLQAIVFLEDRPRHVRFELDPGWLENLRAYSKQQAELRATLDGEPPVGLA
jgi:hypothetical protein